jgi:transcriptional regulator with XRE-family HTH domain
MHRNGDQARSKAVDPIRMDALVAPSARPPARAVGPVTNGTAAALAADPGRRPVEPWEQPFLTALGAELRVLRQHAGLTQAALASRAGLAERSLRRIEHGQRRTRRSTLARLAAALLPRPSDGTAAADLVEGLVRTAGPALAAESVYTERVQARRERRRRRAASRYIVQHTVQYQPHPDGLLETHVHSEVAPL